MTTIRPAIVIMTKFKLPNSNGSKSKNHERFLDYIDRKNTKSKINDYKNYQDYMANDEKTSGLFTKDIDLLTMKQKQEYKNIFADAQQKGSVMWQDVISFDNDWLSEIGILKGNFVDDVRLKQAIRNGMASMLSKENIDDSTQWTAAIHYNTDNIHVHVATVQTHNFRERGKRKQLSIDSVKSQVANTLLDRSKENEKLNDFIRNKVIAQKRNDPMNSLKNKVVNKQLVQQFKKIHAMLPADKRLWKYNMNGIAHTRKEIDVFTTMYLNKYFKNEFEDFKKELDKSVEHHKRIYGENSNAEKYKDTKMKDLYARMGNTVLTEIREYDKSLSNKNRQSFGSFSRKNKLNRFVENREFNNLFRKIDFAMNNNLQHYKNQNEYERLQREREFNNEMGR